MDILKGILEQKKDIIEFGSKLNRNSLDIAAFPLQNNNLLSIPKKKSLKKNIQISSSKKILVQDSISKEKNLKPYWNEHLLEIQSQLWLPHKIEFVAPDSHLLNGSLNYTEEKLNYWKKQMIPKDLIRTLSYPSLPPLSIPITEKEVILGSRKIRIYPNKENTLKLNNLLSLHRRSYNLTIEYIKNNKNKLDKTKIRSDIREKTREEFKDRNFISVVSDEAVNSAFNTFQSLIKKWKKKEKAELKFKSKKNPKQHFTIQKLSKNGAFPTIINNLFHSEEIPKEAIGRMARICIHNGRWFLVCKKEIKVEKCENQTIQLNKIVSLDPGIRTFITTYSNTKCNKYGEEFTTKLYNLFFKLDKFLSKISLLKNKELKIVEDLKIFYYRKINKIRNKIHDIVESLHNNIIKDLIKNFDCIIMPSYNVSEMVSKNDRKIDKLRTRTMLSLRAFDFKQKLKWICLKFNKLFIETTEEYTSKTCSWNGIIKNNLGGNKVIKDNNISMDRDLNGARGIFLKTLWGT